MTLKYAPEVPLGGFPRSGEWEHMVLQHILTMGGGKDLVTWIYKALIDMAYTCPRATRNQGERDMGKPLTDREWVTCLEPIKKVLRFSRMEYTQVNDLHQCYLAATKITRMFGGMPRTCPRCNSTSPPFYHMVWECQMIGEYWSRMIAHLNRTLIRNLLTLAGCLLGVLKCRPGRRQARD